MLFGSVVWVSWSRDSITLNHHWVNSVLLDHLSNIHWVYSIGSIYIAGQLLVLYLLDTVFVLVAGLTVNSLWTLGLPSLRVLN